MIKNGVLSMGLKKYLIFITVVFAFVGKAIFAAPGQDESRFLEELNERDFDALKDFLRSKRIQNVEEEGEDKLVINGDVRAEWRYLTERQKGHSLRGKKAHTRTGLPISNNDFDIEMNLRLDYVTKRTWSVVHVQYDNAAGVDDNEKHCTIDPEGYHGSGECADLCLKKAFFGYNVFDDGCSRFDIELGRRNLYNAFDSRIQFLSRFDGILFTYTCNKDIADLFCLKTCGSNSSWYLMLGGFVIDERVNELAWATELGFLNVLDSGLDFKYSFIDWEKHGKNRCHARNPRGFKFLNSQFTLIYNFEPEIICKKAKIFGAYLINHAGRTRKYVDKINEKGEFVIHTAHHQNTGWYVGFLIGEVLKEGDWSFEMQYQYVQAFSIPDKDVSGIGRGNVLKDSITAPGARGNTNYKGWRFEALYALTDELTVDSIFEFSQAVKDSIGGSHHYSKFEIETIYAF
jgi:hypothetical protein